jgi:2'-hydroxyisoflavone reductase
MMAAFHAMQRIAARISRMNVLILGGTRFLGRHLVHAALSRGHDVTLFNRGKTNTDLFPSVETLHGDRSVDLSALRGRRWDAVIDTCGYVPAHAHMSARALADSTDVYAFVSSVSAYRDSDVAGIDESYPLATLPADEVEKVTSQAQITGENYGALKALCEGAVEQAVPGRAFIIRPGLIVGPHDPTDRFTFWVRRIGRGGDVLVPDTLFQPWQVIDARDLAQWMIAMIEGRQTGVFNATGPAHGLTFGEVVEACRRSESPANVVKARESFIVDEDAAGWEHLPLWLPSSEREIAGFYKMNCKKAMDAGLAFRPVTETVRDTWDWDRAREGELALGLSRERELELIAKWQNHTA